MEARGPLELGLQAVVSHPAWALGCKPGLFARAVPVCTQLCGILPSLRAKFTLPHGTIWLVLVALPERPTVLPQLHPQEPEEPGTDACVSSLVGQVSKASTPFLVLPHGGGAEQWQATGTLLGGLPHSSKQIPTDPALEPCP